MIKGLGQKVILPQPLFLYQVPRDWIRLCYCSIILSSGYPAFMYALFAPLGTISLRLLGVFPNTSESANCGGLFPLNTTLVKWLQP